MKGFVQDIEGIAVKNEGFRRVLYTAKNCQLVVMALVALREKKPDVARAQLTELVAEFPQNPLFASELAKLNALSTAPRPQ